MTTISHIPHAKHRQHRKPGSPQTPQTPGGSVTKKRSPPGKKRQKPAPLAADHVGVDRKNFPSLKGHEDQPRTKDDIQWVQRLFTFSNLRFMGAYVSGQQPSGEAKERFTRESLDERRAWLPNLAALAGQGWGIVFWYMGFNLGHEPRPRPLKGQKADRTHGTRHGKHLRVLLAALGDDWAGATVMIDQEDDKGTKLNKEFIEYYQALFDEMSRPDPELPAFRPGMYCRIDDAGPHVHPRPELFLWEVKYDTKTNATTAHPFEAKDPQTQAPYHKLMAFPHKRPISPALLERGQKTAWILWPVGRQFRRYLGQLPTSDSPVPPIKPPASPWVATKHTRDWDFDSALVRNPAFPIAEPRIAATDHLGGVVLLRGHFAPPESSPASRAHPAMMNIEQMTLPRPTALPRSTGKSPAPEAPMLLLHRPKELLAITVLQDKRLGIAARSDQSNPKKWSALDALPGTQTDVRRLYAMAGVTLAPDDVQVYFIGKDQHLHVCRSLKGAAWTEEEVLTDERLHPFSQLAAVTRGTHTVAVFFLDERGCLAVVFWATAAKWPAWKRVALEGQPSAFLSGTSLAAVSPSDQEIFVFGIGRDLRLTFVSYSAPSKTWTSPAPLGAPKEMVAPHARIAAHVATPDRIEVVALTDDGRATIYPLTRVAGAFRADARLVIDNPPAPTGNAPIAPSQSGRASAPGYRLNPFGDLAILRGTGGVSVIYAPGLRDGNHKILRRELHGQPEWEVFTA